jgi:hypothetical protein
LQRAIKVKVFDKSYYLVAHIGPWIGDMPESNFLSGVNGSSRALRCCRHCYITKDQMGNETSKDAFLLSRSHADWDIFSEAIKSMPDPDQQCASFKYLSLFLFCVLDSRSCVL